MKTVQHTYLAITILTLRAARSMSSRLRVGAFSDIAGETYNVSYQVSQLFNNKYLGKK